MHQPCAANKALSASAAHEDAEMPAQEDAEMPSIGRQAHQCTRMAESSTSQYQPSAVNYVVPLLITSAAAARAGITEMLQQHQATGLPGEDLITVAAANVVSQGVLYYNFIIIDFSLSLDRPHTHAHTRSHTHKHTHTRSSAAFNRLTDGQRDRFM